jgi:hypothetical protein
MKTDQTTISLVTSIEMVVWSVFIDVTREMVVWSVFIDVT